LRLLYSFTDSRFKVHFNSGKVTQQTPWFAAPIPLTAAGQRAVIESLSPLKLFRNLATSEKNKNDQITFYKTHFA
jgi:hypothetical protein